MAQHNSPSKPAWLLPVIVGVLALIVIALGYFVVAQPTVSQESTAPASTNDDGGGVVDVVPQDEDDQIDLSHIEQREPEDPLAIGPVDAPVTLVVFSDYQCPFCASWSDETLPVMMEYVDDEQLRIEWRDVNVYGADSERAAKAAYAAALQGQFWVYHDELYANGEIRQPDELTEAALTDLADELELDTEQFAADMHSNAVAEQIDVTEQLGLDIGAYSTPAFVVAGKPMVGAQPTDVFVEAVDDALADAQ